MQTPRLFKDGGIKSVVFTAVLLTFSITQSFAQLFNVGGPAPSYGGTMVYVAPGAQMYIGGDMKIWDDTMINQGHVIVDGRFFNEAQCGGNGSPLPGNNGLFEIRGERWVNDGDFYSGTGKVIFNGDIPNQSIAGSNMTSFYDLEIDSGTVKRLELIDSEVKNHLELNDKEFATENNTLFVLNPNANAITRADSGFVSSLIGGALSRNVADSTNYLFPVGSSLFTGYRYRPVLITPNDFSPRTYTVRMVNSSPSPNPPNGPGYDVNLHDDSTCFVNDSYWYEIKNTSNNQGALADMSLAYDAQSEGGFNGIARWDLNANPQRWNSLNSEFTVNNYFTTPTNYIIVTRKDWFNYDPNNSAYSLSFRNPYPPVISGPVDLCADDDTLYTVTPSTPYNTTFTWQVTNGEVADSTNTGLNIIWNDVDSGYITVIETVDNFFSYSGSCASYPGQLAVDIWPLPEAIFGIDYQYNNGLSVNPNQLLFTDELVTYTDSSTNTQDWYWDFGDNSTSNFQNPFHTYDSIGPYTVMLVTTSPDGCLDTAYQEVMVSEGLIIPNVFTPNGDGMNDVFTIRNSNLSGEFKFEVYNRWGNLIYTTQSPDISWDGRTTAGIEAPAGTYFWTVAASLQSGNTFTTNAAEHPFAENGTVTLIR